MDAPPIQYARTEDGVNIAWWTLGEGSPVVLTNGAIPVAPSSSWPLWEPVADWFLQRGLAPVSYDVRGTGLSSGDRDWTLDAMVGDLAAVVDAVDQPLTIMGHLFLGPASVAFTVRRPEAVQRLVLVNTFAKTEDYLSQPRTRTFFDLIRQNWEVAIETLPTVFWRTEDPDFAQAMLREIGQAAFVGGFDVLGTHDVTGDLPQVAVPSLVVQSAGWPQGRPEQARELAAGIPDATLALVETDQMVAQELAVLAALGGFLVDDVMAAPTGFRTLMFTDLESSTALTQSLGDAKAQEILRGHNAAVRAALAAHGGEEVKHTGDGIFAAFTSAVSAVEAALQIQRELAGAEVRVRIGLNAGEPIAEDDDYFGAAVQLAARVCDRAEPGQVLVSNVVKELCTGKLFQFDDQGEATLKGFPEPLRLFVVGEGE